MPVPQIRLFVPLLFLQYYIIHVRSSYSFKQDYSAVGIPVAADNRMSDNWVVLKPHTLNPPSFAHFGTVSCHSAWSRIRQEQHDLQAPATQT